MPAKFEVDIDTSEIESMIDNYLGAVYDTTKDTANQVLGDIKRDSPVDTGRLAGSWRLTENGFLEWVVYTNVHYALDVHDGIEPHEIVPVNAQALYWEGAAHPVKRVMHPGTSGQPFTERALENADKNYMEMLMDRISREGA